MVMPRIRKLEALNDIIVTSYKNGASIKNIAFTNNVSSGTIRNILIRQGVSIKKQGRRHKGQTHED